MLQFLIHWGFKIPFSVYCILFPIYVWGGLHRKTFFLKKLQSWSALNPWESKQISLRVLAFSRAKYLYRMIFQTNCLQSGALQTIKDQKEVPSPSCLHPAHQTCMCCAWMCPPMVRTFQIWLCMIDRTHSVQSVEATKVSQLYESLTKVPYKIIQLYMFNSSQV